MTDSIKICGICQRETDKLHRHHIVPKAKGGTHGEVVKCCGNCNKQVHLLFNEKELSCMSLNELIETESMQKYIKWIKKRPGNFKGKMSNRIKRRR